jgi:(E)-4-hydroxy-3-methylbut-2-enyl-diphosphate synthase
MIKRRKTRQIKISGVKIGGNAAVCIQSMAKTDTRDVKATVSQIEELQNAGCQIVRVAVKDIQAARAIKKNIGIPLVADIHFNYRLALVAIEAGADKIRLNPGNIRNKEEIRKVCEAAKRKCISIRIGVNSGSVIRHKNQPPAETMVKAALDYANILEGFKFRDIIISLKASDVATTIRAYRLIAGRCNYPLHLGVTAAGSSQEGITKSAIGIGSLLVDGIGDTIRVSLTGNSTSEIKAAKDILEAVGLASSGVQIISCPTCGRCQVDLVGIVEELKEKISGIPEAQRPRGPASVKVAVMGCEVNGPGEAKDADIGIAAGKNSGMLFKKGRPIRKVAEKDFVKTLLEEIEKIK